MKILIQFIVLLLTIPFYGQPLSKIAVKAGQTFCGQQKTPPVFGDGGMTNWFSATIEPTWFTFGRKKQFDVNSDISFIRKGGVNISYIHTYDQFGQPAGVGSETYRVAIDYFSFSPNLKWNWSRLFFIKAGPRLDAFLNFNTWDSHSSDPRTKSDFESLTYGVTYGVGATLGKKRAKLILEVLGQNDFSTSSYNPSTGQTFTNYCFLLNAGVVFGFRAQ